MDPSQPSYDTAASVTGTASGSDDVLYSKPSVIGYPDDIIVCLPVLVLPRRLADLHKLEQRPRRTCVVMNSLEKTSRFQTQLNNCNCMDRRIDALSGLSSTVSVPADSDRPRQDRFHCIETTSHLDFQHLCQVCRCRSLHPAQNTFRLKFSSHYSVHMFPHLLIFWTVR